MTQPLNHRQDSAFQLMADTLTSWGLSALLPDLRRLIIGGDTDPSTLALALSQTDAYKTRFAGNTARIKAGLPELKPAEYIALEETYRQAAQEYDLPSSFLSKEMTDKLIANDVHGPEFQERLQARADLVYNAPPEALDKFNQWYAGGKGGAIAALLDPSRAHQLLLKQVAASEIGGVAAAAGLNANQSTAERLAGEGVTLASARQAYADIANRLTNDQAIGNRFGTTINQGTEERAVFEGDALATRKLDTAYSEEASLFTGRGGASATTGDKGANY